METIEGLVLVWRSNRREEVQYCRSELGVLSNLELVCQHFQERRSRWKRFCFGLCLEVSTTKKVVRKIVCIRLSCSLQTSRTKETSKRTNVNADSVIFGFRPTNTYTWLNCTQGMLRTTPDSGSPRTQTQTFSQTSRRQVRAHNQLFIIRTPC